MNPVLLILFVVTLAGLVLWIVQAHRLIVFARQQVATAWDELKRELVARREMVPYIVATVHVNSAQVIEVIGNACDLAANVIGVRECCQAEARLTAAIARLFAVLDQGPKAAAGDSLACLRARWKEQEVRITMLAEAYNRRAETFNTLLARGPARWLTYAMVFRHAELYA